MIKEYHKIAFGWAKKHSKKRADTCEPIRWAAQRFLADLKRVDDPKYAFIFLPSAAARACYFIEQLPHVRGKTWSGQNFILEDWQVFFVANIFGWVHKRDNGRRRFSEAWLEVARKNGKSSLAAGICLYMFCADGELGPDVYCCATKEDQARIIFNVARSMARRLPDLVDHYQIDVGSNEAIVEQAGAGRFEPLPANAEKLDGLNPHLAVLDEVHAMKTASLRDVLKTAMGAREQALLLEITTAGMDMDGIGFRVHSYAQEILSGKLNDPSFFAMIFTLDKDDDWEKPVVWQKANPNLGVSVFEKNIVDVARQAKNDPATLSTFLQKNMNVWTNEGAAWIPAAVWNACADDDLRLEDFYPENNGGELRRAWGGLDLAQRNDLASFVLLIPEFGDELYDLDRIYVWAWCWLPKITMEQERVVKEIYQNYIHNGGTRLTLTAGNRTEFGLIERHVWEMAEHFNIVEIGADPAMATYITQRLRAGATLADGRRVSMDVIDVRQGRFTFHQPMEFLKACILDKKLSHENDYLLNWQMNNVETSPPDANGNMRPIKRAPFKKIDAPVAMINAMTRLLPFVEKNDIVEDISGRFQDLMEQE